MSYAIRIDYPPTVNTYYRHSAKGMYLSASGRRFKESTSGLCRHHGVNFPMRGRLGVQIELASPNKRRDSDIDNRVKAVLDSLEGIAFENDRQIDQLIVKRLPIDEGGDGYADVIVSELPCVCAPEAGKEPE